MRALLVGPASADWEILAAALGQRGFIADFATTAKEGWEASERHRYPLVAVDTDAEGTLDLVRQLRGSAGGSHLVLLGLTADPTVARIQALVDATCSDYLVRPLDPATVEARLLVITTWVYGNTTLLEVSSGDSAAAAEKVAESEARYRALADAAEEGVVVHEHGTIQFYNRALAQMFGYGPDELIGAHVSQLHPPAMEEKIRALIGGPPRNHGELVGRRKDGSTFPLAVDARVVDVGGRTRRVAVLRDLTTQKAAERALQDSNTRFELVARATNDAIYDWDIPGRTVIWNEAIGTLFGFRGDRSAADLDWWNNNVHPEDLPRVDESLHAALVGDEELWTYAYRFRRADGSYADVIDRGLMMREANGRATRMIGVMTDITAHNELKARLVLADRMASVGTLAAGVAHEINNPLTWVMAKVELATETLANLPRTPATEQVRDSLYLATEGAQRIRQIVKDLKLFSRAEEESHLPVDVRRVLDSAASIANAEIRRRARLVKEYGDVPVVDVNEARLGQVFLNLIINAAQAIPPGNPDAHTITLRTRLDPEHGVTISVADTGPGVPPQVRSRIFDAFYTTKPPGEGTGLGLAICRQLVVQMGGDIDVENEPGAGACFRVRLPGFVDREAVSSTEPPRYPEVGPRRGRVLLIDDEQMIVSFLERVVELEHEVESYTEPRKALERLLGGTRYDVILCDLMMPEVTGPDIFQALSRADPEQARRVIFITGGAFTPRVRAFLDETQAPVLEKPFDIGVLQRMLRERVDALAGSLPG